MTPTLAQALSHIAPAYSAAQHTRAAERMVQNMEKTAHTPGLSDQNNRLYQFNSELVTQNNRLVAALENIVALVDKMDAWNDTRDEIQQAARAAIAKARGK